MTDFNTGKHPPAAPPEPISERLRANLKAYCDGELSPLHRRWIGWQIARNPACCAELVWLARLGEDMKQLPTPTPRPELRARILDSLPPTPTQRSAPLPRRRAPWLALGGSLAATLLFALMVGAQSGWWQPKPPVRQAVLPVVQNTGKPSLPGNASQSGPALFSSPVTQSPEIEKTAPPVTLPSDPVSDAADKLAAQRMNDAQVWRTQELARQQHEQRLLVLAAKARAASLRPVDATLTVPNVTATREELIACAMQAGGHLLENAPVGTKSGLPAPVRPDENRAAAGASTLPPAVGSTASHSPAAGTPVLASTLTTIAFAVPVSRADVMRSKLHGLGALPAETRTKTHLAAVLPREKALPNPAFRTAHAMSEEQLPGRAMQRAEENEPFVTFTVHLSPVER